MVALQQQQLFQVHFFVWSLSVDNRPRSPFERERNTYILDFMYRADIDILWHLSSQLVVSSSNKRRTVLYEEDGSQWEYHSNNCQTGPPEIQCPITYGFYFFWILVGKATRVKKEGRTGQSGNFVPVSVVSYRPKMGSNLWCPRELLSADYALSGLRKESLSYWRGLDLWDSNQNCNLLSSA